MQYILLKDIGLESLQTTIKVRVVRFCECLNNDTPPQPMWLDLILLDEQGNTMAAQVPERWVQHLKKQLTEDSVYYIKYFQVLNARQKYRPVDHSYMMRFTAHTSITEARLVPDTFPMYACRPVSFDILREKAGKTDCTLDTLGILTGSSHIKLQSTSKGNKKLRTVHITDEKETKAVVALWGQQAESFNADEYMEMAAKGPVVILFVGVTSRLFNDTLSLQGSTVCRFYVNPALLEAVALQNSTGGKIAPTTWYGPTLSQAAPIDITVAELAKFKNPHLIYTNKYVTTIKIKSIAQDQSWWYFACTVPGCNRSVKAHGGLTRCTGPTCSGTTGNRRYRLSLLVTNPANPPDDHGLTAVEMVFFGPKAEEIVGCPVDTLIDSGGGFGSFIPTRITALYGKQFIVRVSVSSQSLQKTDISYQVDSIIGVPTIPEILPAEHHIAGSSTQKDVIPPDLITQGDVPVTPSQTLQQVLHTTPAPTPVSVEIE